MTARGGNKSKLYSLNLLHIVSEVNSCASSDSEIPKLILLNILRITNCVIKRLTKSVLTNRG